MTSSINSSPYARNLTLYYQNVRGLRTKLKHLHLATLNENFNFLVLTETWLHMDILDNELLDNRYTIFRTDRNPENSSKSLGGGVLIAIKKPLKSYKIVASKSVEELWIRVF